MYVASTDAGEVDAEPVVSTRREEVQGRHDSVILDYDEDGHLVGIEFPSNRWFVSDTVRVERAEE